MESVIKHKWIYLFALVFIGLNAFLVFQDNYYLNALPFALIIVYMAFFHIEQTFLLVAFLTPISVNLEEFTEGRIGLFLPTEPILFGLMLLIIMKQLKSPFIPRYVWNHPITWSLAFYLFWVFITSITSTHPIVSFKFLLMKSWFIIPLLLLGVKVFSNPKNIERFLWLFTSAMMLIIGYTLSRHAGYNFGEKEGHWVMEPFYKDHTIYGAGVAIQVFFVLGLYLYKKHSAIIQFVLLSFFIVTLIGLYFSYTRGAWLSVIVALMVWFFIHYKVKFKWLLTVALGVLAIVAVSWTEIQFALAKNRSEHTTEEFSERMKSTTNVTSDASNLERLNRWSAAWRMFEEKPVFGFGPSTYAFEYAPYQDPDKLTIISTNFGDGGNAHSEYLGPLAEMGLIGFLAVLIFVSVLFYKGITLYIRMPKSEDQLKRLLLFLILAAVTYFFHGILNNYLDTDKAAVPIYSICAIIIALEQFIDKKYAA